MWGFLDPEAWPAFVEDVVPQLRDKGWRVDMGADFRFTVIDIDASALESLGTIVQRLREAGVQLHLSEVKGPVMDRLKRSDFLERLTGKVFFTHHQAVTELTRGEASEP